MSRISSIALNAETTRVSWTPASDEGSGIAGYEYRLETADGSFTEWNTTRYPGAQIPTSFEDGWIEIRAKDKTGNRGPAVGDDIMGYRASIADKAAEVYRLVKEFGNDMLPYIGGFICGEHGGVCSKIPQRDSVKWLIGEIAGGVLVVGDIRDFILAIPKGDGGAGLIALAGLVPLLGDSGKAAHAIRKFVKRTKLPLADVMSAVARVGGKDSKLTETILDQLTGKAYGKFRKYDISHDGVEQLARSGNDLAAIAKRARLARRPMSAEERAQVENFIGQHWKHKDGTAASGKLRAEALGVECSLRYLQRNKDIKILVSGRPNTRPAVSGPDIVAYDTRRNRLIVVEAKGTLSYSEPLTLRKMQSKVGDDWHVQPSVAWLVAKRKNDYVKAMLDSPNKEHQLAGKMMQQLRDGKRTKVDLKIVHVRPDNPGSQAYGQGVDAVTRNVKASSRVDQLDVIDVPY